MKTPFDISTRSAKRSAETGSYRMRGCLAYPAAKIKVIFHFWQFQEILKQAGGRLSFEQMFFTQFHGIKYRK
jgi:hypothetical protein